MQVPSMELAFEKFHRGEGAEECFYVGGALLPFALDFVFKRKPMNDRGSFIARPAPSFGITSPNIQHPPPRCGREATAPPTPKSKPRGVVSRLHLPKPRRPRGGRRSRHPGAVPANAGTHNHRSRLKEKSSATVPNARPRRMGPCVRR